MNKRMYVKPRTGLLMRAESLKGLKEQRADLLTQMETLTDAVKTEKRAFTEDEIAKFNVLEKQVKDIDATIAATERAAAMTIDEAAGTEAPDPKEPTEAMERRAFEGYIRGIVLEERAATNLEKGVNGAVIPKTIANKIIETVKELSPIYAATTKYHVKGELSFPVYDESTQRIQCAYANEFTALTSTAGKFTSVSLTGFLAGVLSKVSKSLVNNAQFDLVSYTINKVAQAVAEFLENELINGTASKMTGITSATTAVTAASATAVTADELIDLQMSVPEVYQGKCEWYMHKDTLKLLRKLKDNDGNYVLNRDLTTAFGWTLLGRPIKITESMPKAEAGKVSIVYGDMSGLYVKIVEDMDIQVLTEKFADEHAIGVIAWLEMDSKIIEPQKIVSLKMKAGA